MGLMDVAAKAAQGFAGAAGDTDSQAQIGNWQAQRQNQRQQQLQLAIAPLSQSLAADRERLKAFTDPNTGEPVEEHQADYDKIHNRMVDTIGQMRELLGQHPPGETPFATRLLDKFHVANDLSNHFQNKRTDQVNQYYAQNRAMADATINSALPFALSDEAQKIKLQHELAKPNYQNVQLADGTTTAMDLAHYSLPLGAKLVGKTSQSGVPRVIGRTSVQSAIKLLQSGAMKFPLANGQDVTLEQLQSMPSYMELTQVRQGDKDIYYPTDQRTHISTVGNVRYQVPDVGEVLGQSTPLGEARTPSTTVDPFGVSQTTTPASSGMVGGGTPQVPQSTPSVAPPGPVSPTPTPKHDQLHQIKQGLVSAATQGPQLDTNGHIPAGVANPYVVQAANSILDGMDVDKLPVPARDRAAAMQLASQYGWKGQGLFTPREVLQLKEGATVIDNMLKSKSLQVLDQDAISQLPMLGQSPEPGKAGFLGRLATKFASGSASPEQQEFLRYWRQLDALAIGLRGLVQTGRATQAQVERLIAELPNPYNTTSSKDAENRLRMVQNELQVAARTGRLSDVPLGTQTNGNSQVDDIVDALRKHKP